LNTQSIGTLIHYPIPPHLQPAYGHLPYQKGSFPLAEAIAETCLSLPIWPGLTKQQVFDIAKLISTFFN
jgi:dTDP-4-amino-4,6-dideoxygalactose transaminase